jgi:hypothetical protein
MNVNSFPVHCIYDGPSAYNGSRIRAYIYAQTGNGKTGRIAGLVVVPVRDDGTIPTYFEARREGLDIGVCGSCDMRSKASGGSGLCYVGNGSQVGMGLQWIARAGDLPIADWRDVRRLIGFVGLFRSAVWGDAAALPVDTWATIEAICRGQGVDILGYTHGWRVARHLVGSHMASVSTMDDREFAQSTGWRTFYVAPVGTEAAGEISCPASVERGHKLQCADCLTCGSRGYARKARSVVIWAHDSGSQHKARKALASLSLSN